MKVEFTGECDLRVLPDDKWLVLSENFGAKITGGDGVQGWLFVPKDFVTDLASVPRFPGMYMLAGGKARKSAVLHDFLYSQAQQPREWCDAVFLAAMRNEEPGWRRALMWAGVRVGGWIPFYRSRGGLTNEALGVAFDRGD